jgi:membrane protein
LWDRTERTDVIRLARLLVREARDQQVTFLAAAVAYFAFVSMVPLALVAVAVGTALGGERIATALVVAAGEVLAPAGQDLLRDAVVGASGRAPATLASVLVLLWSGLRVFRALDAAFDRVYDVDAPTPFLRQVADAVVALGAIVGALLGGVVLLAVVPLLDVVPARLLAPFTLPVVLAVSLLPVYYLFPDTEDSVRAVLPGTAFAAVGWTVLAVAFREYVRVAGQYDLYGLLGGALLLVTGLYFAGIIIILGGVLNAVLAGRADDPEEESPTDRAEDRDGPAPDIVELDAEVRALRERLEEKTVSRSALESDLKGYVRSRVRRGHARGWGPYLVLLYGTVMTVAAFYLLRGGWAILAMVVVWLSTLGLYTLMVLAGVTFNVLDVPGRVADWVRSRR